MKPAGVLRDVVFFSLFVVIAFVRLGTEQTLGLIHILRAKVQNYCEITAKALKKISAYSEESEGLALEFIAFRFPQQRVLYILQSLQ